MVPPRTSWLKQQQHDKTGQALQYAAEAIKANHEIILAAVTQLRRLRGDPPGKDDRYYDDWLKDMGVPDDLRKQMYGK